MQNSLIFNCRSNTKKSVPVGNGLSAYSGGIIILYLFDYPIVDSQIQQEKTIGFYLCVYSENFYNLVDKIQGIE